MIAVNVDDYLINDRFYTDQVVSVLHTLFLYLTDSAAHSR